MNRLYRSLVKKTPPSSTVKPGLLFIYVCVLSLVMISCSSNSTGSNSDGPTYNGGDQNPGGNEPIGTEPTFTNIQQIFQQNCGSCHIGTRTNGVQLDSYQNVIESVGTDYGEEVVQPGDAEGSPLVDKIEPDPTIPPRMPQGGPYLSSDRIAQIRAWIDNGALND